MNGETCLCGKPRKRMKHKLRTYLSSKCADCLRIQDAQKKKAYRANKKRQIELAERTVLPYAFLHSKPGIFTQGLHSDTAVDNE